MRKIISLILNIIIVIFGITGTYLMFTFTGKGTGLTASGFQNFKFFTVLSNEFCMIVSIIWIIFFVMKKEFPILIKLMAAASVGLTFIIIAAFLAPMYPDLNMYSGSNLWFHLILPLTAMLEFILLDSDIKRNAKIPFRYTILSAVFALVYGTFYMVNILINGIGTWPDSNDWYGFLNWGWPVGIGIFGFIVLMNWGMACLLRWLNNLLNKCIEKFNKS